MAHLTTRSGYESLVERLNRAPQGAPPSAVLYEILKMLFTEEEAQLAALLPIKPFDVKVASRAWKQPAKKTQQILDRLADKGILLDMVREGRSIYILPPPMIGFFEFAMMRVRDDLDQKLLAELFHQYVSVEEDFVKDLFNGETKPGRILVNEEVLPVHNTIEVLDYERASAIVETASHIGVGVCYCRHKAEHLGEVCDAPMNNCLTFNITAESLINHGIVRQIDAAEAADILAQARQCDLVQFADNVQRDVNFICNCCGCCCEALGAVKRFTALTPLHTTNYEVAIDEEACNGCRKCVDVCPVDALSMVESVSETGKKIKKARLDPAVCLGCGVCVRHCKKDALKLAPRSERVITPVDGAHRTVLMAVERGKLEHLIFDNRAHLNHRAMAAILGAVLRLEPVKRAMAGEQMRSRYLERLISLAGVVSKRNRGVPVAEG